MRIAYLQCFSGISGDMFLGALVDAGVSPKLLMDTVAALGLDAHLEISRVDRSGISATKVDVWVGGEKDQPRDDNWRVRRDKQVHARVHDHQHPHPHVHDLHTDPEHEDDAQHAHHAHGRALSEIRQIIERAPISESAKARALAIFEALGKAEAKVHGCNIEQVHFHEVGAVDAIVDIVCAAVGSETLGVDEWVCSPLNVGGGTVECAHGRFPVPAPAVVELLKGGPVYSSGIEKELVTPTGAAIVSVLATRFGELPPLRVEASGYGAGSRDIPGAPNVLRLIVGEAVQESRQTADTISVLEANLDDLNPQVFGYVMDRLLAEGALDVFATPAQMKKNRPGTVLTVLALPQDAERLTRLIFAESTTLGVRMREERREVLVRRSLPVQTPWGEVQMKLANLNGTVVNYAPEYEDCRRIASERGVPLKRVMQEAIRAYLDQQNE
ncbi:MAG TPA: nickel pincer cofactor biosynthesis protein LarC [Terriglobales bacterium]|nr:nickel pincer cofactor biosynthesis protein LarC [Terriglobales bacterium]